jgi:dimethylargininase
MFRRAIVRPPGACFAGGLTTAGLGPPDLELARSQHERYCEALRGCGLEVIRLPEDSAHPDSTFVEDTAVITERGAILTRPGAPSRAGEVAGIRSALEPLFPDLEEIVAPGTLDGGDVCEAGDRFFIGLSERTNAEGARQLAAFLRRRGYEATCVDIRNAPGLLHLKSGVAYLGGGTFLLVDALAGHDAFLGVDRLIVDAEESYAANGVRINGALLLASGFPRVERELRRRGERPIVLEMSEFRKMDGGLSCLSLRF